MQLSVFFKVNLALSLHTDPLEDLNDSSTQTATNSAAELLKQGAGETFTSAFYNIHRALHNLWDRVPSFSEFALCSSL